MSHDFLGIPLRPEQRSGIIRARNDRLSDIEIKFAATLAVLLLANA